MKNSMEVLQETKTRITIWPSNPTPGHISRQNYNLKRHMHPYVHSSTIHDSQDTETTYVSIDRWTDTDMAHTCKRIPLSRKIQKNAIWSNVEATGNYHPKWSELERERQISHEITYMWNLKYDTGNSLEVPVLRTQHFHCWGAPERVAQTPWLGN